MGESSFDVVVVRKSGPVHSMRFRGWWIYLMLLIMLVMVTGLGFSAYLIYQQQRHLVNLGNDTRLLMLRAERLESLVQEQETRELLALQAAQEQAELAREKAEKEKKKPGEAEKPKDKPSAKGGETPAKPAIETAAPAPAEVAAAPQAVETPPEPEASDWVDVNDLNLERKGAEMVVRFKVQNKKNTELAAGYVTVLLKGTRNGKPWNETWPAMRLTPQQRPKNFRRGSPFSVQNYRTVQARFVVGRKQFENLEILLYSRDGKLSLVRKKSVDMPESDTPAGGQEQAPKPGQQPDPGREG